MAKQTTQPEPINWPRPEELGTPWPVRLVGGLVFLNGIFAILEVITTRLGDRIEGLLPIDYDYLRSLGLFAGFVLIYFALQLWQRKRVAWLITTISSVLIVLVHLTYARSLIVLLLPAVSLVLLWVYRDLFYARSEPASIAQGLRLLGLSVIVAIAYGTLGFWFLLPRDFHQSFSLGQSVWRTLRQYTLVGNTDLIPRTRYAHWFLLSLDVLGVVSVTFAISSLFRPLTYRFRTLPYDRHRARELLERYGTTSEDFFKLWPEDKSYYFAPDEAGFVAYKVAHGIAFGLGDLAADPKRRLEVLQGFIANCRLYGWSPCLLYLNEGDRQIAEDAGLRTIKIGEDAVVDLAKFTGETVRNKHFRHVANKFTKAGYTTEWLAPPQTTAILRQVQAVSRSWLRLPGRVEQGFVLGSFDRAYIERSPLFVVRDKGGQIQAFVNLIPSYDVNEADFDLMRHLADAPTGVMDYLFLELITRLPREGYSRLNLGWAPFSIGGPRTQRNVDEWFLQLLYRNESKLAGFQGLRRYKQKFEPNWRPQYMAYQGGPAGLTRIGLAMDRLLETPTKPSGIMAP